MKTYYRIKFLSIFFTLLIFSSALFSQKKPEKSDKDKKEKTYSDIITDKAVTDQGLFDVHKVDEKYYYEINDSLIGRDMLMVTRIACLPNYNQLEAIITTGSTRYLWEDKLVSTVSNFAKLNNCKKLSFWCRPGWARVSKKWGWKVRHIQMEKDL